MCKTKPILRDRKAYYKSIDKGLCSNCDSSAPYGCCCYTIEVPKRDFRVNFSSEDEIRQLAKTQLFVVHKLKYDWYSARLYLRERLYNNIGMCILWTENGCRLPHRFRPETCRLHTCDQGKFKLNYPTRFLQQTSKHFDKVEEKIIVRIFEEFKLVNNLIMISSEFEKLDWSKLMMNLCKCK